jgi:fructan beta-fructosidase
MFLKPFRQWRRYDKNQQNSGFNVYCIAFFIQSCNTDMSRSTKNAGSQILREVNFREQHRPQFHFSPDTMWMNDPNGMVYYEGEYHLFFQYYPGDIVWGPMHWDHAISKDLVHWEHMPIAIYPDSLGFIFSGSAVVDKYNTSGFGSPGNPPLVIIFTYHNPKGELDGRDDFQTQGIAYSLDRGRSWVKYEGNPVLPNPGIRDFRDPKVMYHESTKKWIMTLAAQDHLKFYSSPNLKDWSLESEFGKGAGAHGGVWECPDLFPLKDNGTEKWILLVSLNPGGPNGGSGTQYFIGHFDGHRFINDNPDETILWIDWGKDNYAGVTWAGIPDKDGRRIFMGWMSNWQYATRVPTRTWRSAMTLPRELSLVILKDIPRLVSKPVREMQQLRKSTLTIDPVPSPGNLDLSGKIPFEISTSEIKLVFQLKPSTRFDQAREFGLELSNLKNERILIGFDPATRHFFIDRSEAGITDFSDAFAGKHHAPYPLKEERIILHIFADVASVELFAQHGKVVMTEIFFPSEEFTRMRIFGHNEHVQLISGTVYGLKSIWQPV